MSVNPSDTLYFAVPFQAARTNLFLNSINKQADYRVQMLCNISTSLPQYCVTSGRYRGIRRPLRQRTQGEHSILYKVALTWGLGLLLASPIPVLALLDMKNIMPSSTVCEMNNQHFLIFGSLLAFYIPMVIMVVTYVLTVHHLKNQRLVSGTLTGARHQITKSSLPSQGME